jgi:hypothetical protein
MRASWSSTARFYIWCEDWHLFLSSQQRPMSKPNGMLLFAKSRVCRMHFKNQHPLIVRRGGNVLEIKAFTVRRRIHPARDAPAKAFA